MVIVLLVKKCAPMTQVVERLNVMAVIVVGGRLESVILKRNRHSTTTLVINKVSNTGSPHMSWFSSDLIEP